MSTETPLPENAPSTAPEADTTEATTKAEGATSNATEPAAAAVAQAPAQATAEAGQSELEAVEVEAESIKPPPPVSLRPKVAKDVTSPPLGVTAQLPAAAWPPRTVADLMTRKIITVGEKEPIGNLEAGMEKFRFRHLPVVGEGMKLIGLISRTDLLHAKLGSMPDGTPAPKVDGETLAGAIMNRNVVFAHLDMPIATACRAMLEKKLTCIPVVLEDNTLVGVLTASDFVRLALEILQPKGK